MMECYKCCASLPTNHGTSDEYPMCEDCYHGTHDFTCEFCGDGLATQKIDFKNGMREWWCPDCEEKYGVEEKVNG